MQPIPFGKYLLVERLAQGGMAEVFRAVYQGAAGFEKQVAVKRILPVFDGAKEFVTMFVDEARIASSLTHVNIVQVSDFGELDGSYYLAMELVDGVDLGRLREAAARKGLRVPVPIAAFIIAEAARGLAYAHEKRGPDGAPLGIVHRDVSPQNVLVSYAGEVKIADFGIAKATGKLHKTESGAVMGKIRYMSPEQIGGEPLDGRSDIFALGTILWELLVGAALWNGDNPGLVSDQIRHMKLDAPSRRGADVPPELDRIALKALERNRDARYARAGELARELSAWLSQHAPSVTREDVGAFVQEVVPRAEAESPSSGSMRPVALGLAPTEMSPARPAAKETIAAKKSAARVRSPLPLVAAATLVLVGAALGARWLTRARDDATTAPPGVPVDGATATARADAAVGPSDADKTRMIAELEALPRGRAAYRGVVAEDYLAILSAVDGAVCLTPAGAHDPVWPADPHDHIRRLALVPEATALARYVLSTGELPPLATSALQSFLKSHPPFSPGAGGWRIARVATLAAPDDAAERLAVIRQNGALEVWRTPVADGPQPYAAQCERQAAVDAYATRAKDPADVARAHAFERFLLAPSSEIPVDDAGLRYQVIDAERDEPSATLRVHLRVTNTSGEDKPLPLAGARLAGLDAAATVDPPATRLGRGLVRELELTFPSVTDEVAEAAVLVIKPGVELQAYSEDLQ